MTLTLPKEKVQRIILDCQLAIRKERVSVRVILRLVRRMSATMLVVLPARLCYRGLQALKNRVLVASRSFETIMSLNEEAMMELQWWIGMNGRQILPPASRQTSTGGLWSEDERTQHINVLELMDGVLATKTFTKGKENLYIHLRMDNTAARSLLYQSDGRYKIPDDVTGSLRPMALVPPAGDNLVGRIFTRNGEHCSRQGVQNSEVDSRMDAESNHMQQSFADTGPMLSRPIRIQTQQPDGQVCQLASRPVCNSNRLVPVVMAGRNWVRISPLCNNR